MATVLKPDPMVIVIRDRKKSKGLDCWEDRHAVSHRTARPLSEVLTKRYPYYAHFFLYTLPGEEAWPRINKGVLRDLEERDCAPVLHVTACEYDNDNHAPLDLKGYERMVDRVRNASVIQPTLIYKTRAGCRLVFVHKTGLSPDESEVFHRSIVHQYHTVAGIPLTGDTWEWNRGHALPFVHRDGVDLDPRPLSWGPVLARLPELPAAPPRPRARTLHLDMPDVPDAEALVWTGANKLTEWGRAARVRMQGRDAEAAFSRETAPTIVDDRNPTLFKWAGSLVSMLRKNPGTTTPAHVFGVLCPTATASMTDDGRDLIAEVWKAVLYCWAHEEATDELHEEQRGTWLEQLRPKLAGNPPQDPDELQVWLRRRLVAVHGTDCYVLTDQGLYQPNPVKQLALVASLRESGMVGPDRVLPDLVVQTKKGMIPLSGQTVVDRFATVVSNVHVRPAGYVGGRLADTTEGRVLTISPFSRRPDLTPRRHGWVADWLAAVGHRANHHETIERWTAAALAVEQGPIAAMSWQGPGGIGKDLYATALANCFTSRTPAKSSIFGNYQYNVDRSPVVHVNEGWPEGVRGIDKKLRELIGGAEFEVNQKYRAYATHHTPLRIFMTGNTDAVVRRLFSRRGVTHDERQAVLKRVIHLDLGPEEDHPAIAFWEEHGEALNWKPETLEQASEHFLWLHQELPVTKKDRFLMIGDVKDPALQAMAFGDDEQAEIGDLLVSMFENGSIQDETVTAGEVLAYRDSLLSHSKWDHFNHITLGRVLAHFRRSGSRRLDLEQLYKFAKAAELQCPKLRRAWKKEQKRAEAANQHR